MSQLNTKVTFKSLAENTGSTEQEVKDLLKSYNLSPDNLTEVQLDYVKAELTKGIQLPSKNVSPKVPLMITDESLPETDSVIDIENMTLEQILEAEKKDELEIQRQEALARMKAKKRNLIRLQESNLSENLALKSSEASYNIRAASQSQLLDLSIQKAKLIQKSHNDREIKALDQTVALAEETYTTFELQVASAKKYRQLSQNKMTNIINNIPEAVPLMKLSGVVTDSQSQTVDVAVV